MTRNAGDLLPAELLSDVRTKFMRYCAKESEELSLSGWKYFVKSCPSGPLVGVNEARLEALFLHAAGPGSSKKRCGHGRDAWERPVSIRHHPFPPLTPRLSHLPPPPPPFSSPPLTSRTWLLAASSPLTRLQRCCSIRRTSSMVRRAPLAFRSFILCSNAYCRIVSMNHGGQRSSWATRRAALPLRRRNLPLLSGSARKK